MRSQQFLMMFIGVGVVLVFLSVVFSDSGQKIRQQVASVVGMYASVEPNEYNILTQQIKDKQEELDMREKDLAEKETLLAQQEAPEHSRTAIIYISIIGTLLLILILWNFVLDWRRRK